MQPSTKVVVEFMVGERKMVGTLAYSLPNGNMLIMCTNEGKRSMWEVPASAETQRFTVKVRPNQPGESGNHATPA
jgi:hypothetical protein